MHVDSIDHVPRMLGSHCQLTVPFVEFDIVTDTERHDERILEMPWNKAGGSPRDPSINLGLGTAEEEVQLAGRIPDWEPAECNSAQPPAVKLERSSDHWFTLQGA